MNYKLAKQLKKAEFPQPEVGYRRDNCWYDGDGELSDWWNGEDSVYIPTLSELIDACGNEFRSLIKRSCSHFWRAEEQSGIETEAKSPEVAMAKLYLKLYDEPWLWGKI